MSTIDITISCPHCRRQYTMKTDPERLQRVKTRATCGRCRNTFDVASRIVAPAGAAPPTEAPPSSAPAALPKLRPPPPPKPKKAASAATTSPSELTELAREFADAAARFTPVGQRPAGLTAALSAETQIPTRPGVKPMSLPDESAWVLPRTDPPKTESETPTAEIARPVVAPATNAPAPVAAAPLEEPALAASEPPAAATPQEAPPSAPVEPPAVIAAPVEPAAAGAAEATAELAAQLESLTAELAAESLAPSAAAAVEEPAAPQSWIDRADPGIAHLVPPPSPAAAALEQLL
jgi:hypothetical protein